MSGEAALRYGCFMKSLFEMLLVWVKLSRKPDPDKYEHAHNYCDVLVVGSGPAGIAAALNAAEHKLDVIIVEQDSKLGGSELIESS